MKKLLFNSLIIGVITSTLGSVVFRIILTRFNKNNENESLDLMLKKYKNNYLIEICLFFTGILIHLLLEYIGLEKWYCSKVCADDVCKIVCEKEI
tara:strand:+ start:110 stop:394 length:285 start_codon:yes stop_codon:yes gene_type:complete